MWWLRSSGPAWLVDQSGGCGGRLIAPPAGASAGAAPDGRRRGCAAGRGRGVAVSPDETAGDGARRRGAGVAGAFVVAGDAVGPFWVRPWRRGAGGGGFFRGRGGSGRWCPGSDLRPRRN